MKPHEFKIEKNIEPPRRKNSYLELINSMEVGDSFIGNVNVANAIRMAVKRFGNEQKIACKTTEEGYRIWRKN